jgi:hypothetical protein
MARVEVAGELGFLMVVPKGIRLPIGGPPLALKAAHRPVFALPGMAQAANSAR